MTSPVVPLARPALSSRSAAPASVRRGRGRPAALTDPERIESLLADISSGATVAEAAASLGMSRTPVYRLRDNDPQFAKALTGAQSAGKAARRRAVLESLQVEQHGTEASYVKRHCPCAACRHAGTRARGRRRATASDAPNSPALQAV
ncbi:hypothetical protein GCM10009577_36770 [Streptomyces javensis]